MTKTEQRTGKVKRDAVGSVVPNPFVVNRTAGELGAFTSHIKAGVASGKAVKNKTFLRLWGVI